MAGIFLTNSAKDLFSKTILKLEKQKKEIFESVWTEYVVHLGYAPYSWIGHELQSGPTLVFSLWLSEFKIKTSFGFLIKKIRGRFFNFFEKSKNELVRPKTMFLAILAKIRSFSNNSDM